MLAWEFGSVRASRRIISGGKYQYYTQASMEKLRAIGYDQLSNAHYGPN